MSLKIKRSLVKLSLMWIYEIKKIYIMDAGLLFFIKFLLFELI